ncbi:hypothetical protein IKQ26_04755 [bacterium]|nr:hypothetical protein [bacterium]
MKFKTACCVFFFIAFLGTANAQKISSSELFNKLPEIEDRECSFKQEKILKNIQKPLVSNGNFKLVKGEGVYFETVYPIKSTVSYTNKEYKQINDIILAVSNRKYSRLDREFSLDYSKNKNVWTLKLEPREGSKAFKYLDFIELTGSEKIDKTVIVTKDGSKTTQWFMEK